MLIKCDARYSLELESELCVNGGYKVAGCAGLQNSVTSFYPKNLFNINDATLDFFPSNTSLLKMNRNELTELLLGKEINIAFVSIQETVEIHDSSIARVGGATGVRDIELLESALHRPMQICLYENETSLPILAASVADGIVQNHAFLDGNKRTGFLACVRFLEKNGLIFSPDVAEAVEYFRQLAAHEISAENLASWIEKWAN